MKAGKRGFDLTHWCLDFGEMTLRRRVRGDTASRDVERRAGMVQAALVHPHETQLEFEKCQRKWRDSAVPTAAFQVQPFCYVGLAALGIESDQGRDIFKTLATIFALLEDGNGFIGSTEALENWRTLAIRAFAIEPRLLGTIEVVKSFYEPMEGGPGPRTCD